MEFRRALEIHRLSFVLDTEDDGNDRARSHLVFGIYRNDANRAEYSGSRIHRNRPLLTVDLSTNAEMTTRVK
jgi:hypothetical protein